MGMSFHPESLTPINPTQSLADLKAAAMTAIEDNAATARIAVGLGDITGAHDALDRIVLAARQYAEIAGSEANFMDASVKWLASKLADATGHPAGKAA